MKVRRQLIEKLLSDFLALNEAATKAFPELPSITERSVLLAIMALSDKTEKVEFTAIEAATGIPTKTLERYLSMFEILGFLAGTKVVEREYTTIFPATMNRLYSKIS
jgi:hypothetical protein